MRSKSLFVCPICGKELEINCKNYKCQKNHSFDAAKSGYINLLTADKMNAKNPGDNKLMVKARSEFLDKGYYSHLREVLYEAVNKISKESDILLDAGCGEGYYTSGIVEKILSCNKNIRAAGVDISKFAADKAAKRSKSIEFAVGSVFHIPFADNSCDILLNVFAPFCRNEYLRVLKKGGHMITVIPDKKHLWEIKRIVYDNPYENKPKNEDIKGFIFEEKISAKRNILLESNKDIENLFAMTPYFYNTSVKDKEKLSGIDTLETQTEFEILIYKKY